MSWAAYRPYGRATDGVELGLATQRLVPLAALEGELAAMGEQGAVEAAIPNVRRNRRWWSPQNGAPARSPPPRPSPDSCVTGEVVIAGTYGLGAAGIGGVPR